MTTEQQTALDIIRTSNRIATPEQLADLIMNPSVPKYRDLPEGARRRWLGDQINGLCYLAHSSRIANEVDLTIEASMTDQAIMDDPNLTCLTQAEMQEAFRRGVTKEYGDFYGVTATSIVGWLRAFMKGDKRQQAKAIIYRRREKEEREADERMRKAIQQLKDEGKFVPTWGPDYDFSGGKKKVESSAEHRKKIEKQREEILKRYGTSH